MARKVLLADDSVTAQNMGRKILTDAGYEVLTVNNGSAALKRVAEHKPDLIVLDVYMPGYSGLEVCMRLKDSPDTTRIPILLTVGKLEPFKPDDARRVRADAFIVKPFEASELLGALTRLEDRVVPQGDGRFSASVDGIERFRGETSTGRSESVGDADSGWKNRIRFPSTKPKPEESDAEVDYVVTPGFRSFRREPPKEAPKPTLANAEAAEEAAAAAAKQETAAVPDLPRDITPEELDALSAVAAKLDAPEATAETAAAVEPSTPGPDVEGETSPEAKADGKSETPVREKVASEPTLPVAEIPPATDEIVSARPQSVSAETGGVGAAAIPAADPAPAPVDREDEPLFAGSGTTEGKAEEAPKQIVGLPVEFAGPPKAGGETQVPEAQLEAETKEPPDAPNVVETKAAEDSATVISATKTVPMPAELPSRVVDREAASEVPPASAAHEPRAEEKAPTEEELAEALRLLTPSYSASDATGSIASGALAAAGAALVEELARGPIRHRWLAEAVALDSEEASISLEAEMFRSATTPPAAPSASAAGIEPVLPSAFVSEGPVSGRDASRELSAGLSSNPSLEPQVEKSQAALSDIPATGPEREPVHEEETESADSSGDEVAPTTFADAVQYAGIESASVAEAINEDSSEESSKATSAPTQQNVEPSSEDAAGGQELMAQDGKGKAGKSGWHQIRSGSAAPPAADAVEAAKQALPDETPKAMAAAAAADGDSASDPNAIASIVDSVLADLRPKIVEEIAKKLAKK